MACLESDSSQFLLNSDVIDIPFAIYACNSLTGTQVVPDHSLYSQSRCTNGPDPPPLPGTSYATQRTSRNTKTCNGVPEEIQHSWNKLFVEGYQADLHVLTDDGSKFLSHSCILGIKSPVLRTMLGESKMQHGFRHILISGVPSEAVHVFIRFLYSSRFEQDEMKKYALHLLVLSHAFSVPSLKMVCIDQLERSFLAPDNVVDMLQLARLCDAPRLSLVCTRMIVGDFKTISLSEGWKLMRQTNPILEQELLESLVEADTKDRKELKGWRKRRFIFNCMKLWKLLFIYAAKDVGQLAPETKNSRPVKLLATFPPARVLRCSCATSHHAKCGCLVVVPTVSACGSFLSCILACVPHQKFAGFPYAGILRRKCNI